MINQRSAGIIIYTVKNKKIFYLLLLHGKKYWNFPKGRMEIGETILETAYRETQEETGVRARDIKLEKGFRSSYRYTFRVEKGRIIYKEVIFFLGYIKDMPIHISDEHKDFEWFGYEEALRRLLHKNSQKLVREAHSFLLKKHYSGNKKN